MKKIFWLILGSLVISLAFNIFFAPYDLVSEGLFGLGKLFEKTYGYHPAIFIAISNIILLIFSLAAFGYQKTEKYLMASFLIPTFIYLTSGISSIVRFNNIEIVIVAIFGAIVMSLGYSLVYKSGFSIGGFEIIQDIFKSEKNGYIAYLIELVIIIISYITMGLESAIYSLIIIGIVINMATKSKLGISTNKTFFIITTKEKEIKDYLVNDLRYDYTEINVKGGFSSKKSKIIMTVIDTKDYYRLKEGINVIDKNAFISIIDNYESINKNITINEQLW